MMYVCHLVNRLPSTAIDGKTPFEKWYGKPATNYDSLHVFGSAAYYHVKESKLDPKEKKALFMGISYGIKGYRLWCPETKKMIFSKDVTFNESVMLKKVNVEQLDGTPKKIQAKEPRQQQHESIATSKPKRNTKRPARLNDTVDCASLIAADDVPTTYSETELTNLPERKKAIGCKWVYAKKEGFPSQDDVCYKERLVAKGYAQKEGIDDNEVFSPVVKHSSIRILLALVAQLDLELVQMDVKTAFLHGNLEEEIYMVQPEGFKVDGKEHELCKLQKSLYELKQSQRFEKQTKRVSTPLTSQFKISIAMSPKNDTERAYMEKVPYANAVGSLMYAMICTRPDISHVVGMVEGYCDSYYAGDLEKQRSMTGYVFTLAKAPVSWKSTLQSTTALSTTEAEYMAMTEAVKEAIWLQGLLAKNQVYHARTKHTDVRYHFIREILEKGGVRIQKIHTSENPTDMLTKVVAGIKIEELVFRQGGDLLNNGSYWNKNAFNESQASGL
ncbi:retrovirus-related pol polyprotein from transposon TNT 1-94 [Tanacetum coccineum]